MPVGSLAVRSPPAIAGHPDGSRWGCEDADDSLSRSTAEIDGIYGATRSSVIATGDSTVAPPAVVRTTKNSRADLLFRPASAEMHAGCVHADASRCTKDYTYHPMERADSVFTEPVLSVFVLALLLTCPAIATRRHPANRPRPARGAQPSLSQ